MPSRPRVLLASLLLAVSARAQLKNIPATPITGISAITPTVPVVMTPATLMPSSVISPILPAMTLTPLLTGPQVLLGVPPADHHLSHHGASHQQAAAQSVQRAVQDQKPATPPDGWASKLNFKPGQEFFDGGTPHSNDGAVFAAIPKDAGSVRVHIVERGPLAAVRPVPGTQGLLGRALFDKVASLQASGQRKHTYAEASAELFSRAENIIVNGVRGVIDAYSGIFAPGTSDQGESYSEKGDDNGDGFHDEQGMNVEHVEPQSLFDRDDKIRADLHILMATFEHPNSVRGNLPFGIVARNIDYENKAGAKRGLDVNGVYVFEPPDAVKGRVARALLYYNTRYTGTRTRPAAAFWNQQINVMLEWNRKFPPDAFEARRNDIVSAFQGNRNVFVDDPGLADRIGAAALWAGPPPTPRQLRRHVYHR
jgi:hypothetical protein